MSNQDAPQPAPPLRAPTATASAPAFFAALGNPLRWDMLKHLMTRPMTASEMATTLKRDFDGVSKHLRVLHRGGVVQTMHGKDRRHIFFYIPRANQPEPGVLDYGSVRLDFRPTAPQEALIAVRA